MASVLWGFHCWGRGRGQGLGSGHRLGMLALSVWLSGHLEVNLKLKKVVTVIWNWLCFPEEVRIIFYKGGKMFGRLSKQASVIDTV